MSSNTKVDPNETIAERHLINRGTTLILYFEFSIVTKCSLSFYWISFIIVVRSVCTMNHIAGAYFKIMSEKLTVKYCAIAHRPRLSEVTIVHNFFTLKIKIRNIESRPKTITGITIDLVICWWNLIWIRNTKMHNRVISLRMWFPKASLIHEGY